MNSKVELDIECEIVLENISFFEWMNLENLLISIKSADLTLLDDVHMEKLESILNFLLAQKLIEVKYEKKNEPFYRRVQIKKKKLLGIF